MRTCSRWDLQSFCRLLLRPGRMGVLAALGVLLVSGVVVAAPVSQRLRLSFKVPATLVTGTAYNFTFRLYDSRDPALAPSPLWEETRRYEVPASRTITHLLSSGTPFSNEGTGLPPVDFSVQLWVEVRAGGRIVRSRAPLGPIVPYALHSESAPPAVQRFTYSGQSSRALASTSAVKMRDLGTFMARGGTAKVTWSSAVGGDGVACNFQIRLNGLASSPTNAAGLAGTEATINGTVGAVPATIVDVFEGLPQGTTTVELWYRSVASSCVENVGNYTRAVIIEEYGLAP